MDILRGDVVRVELNPIRGSEQTGDARPCVIVQNDTGNRHSNTTIIVPLTDAAHKQAYPFQILVPKGEGGLVKSSIAKCEQIRVISIDRIKTRIGTLQPETITRLNAALKSSLGL
ncbi:MAG: type II toxin-antitoxin system PemK/MazF family toxin [Candidatus Marinimicrobia bacterium]|nr:type II toxin-antitoxin system PemK/MazF family toxin [Candidatus Neomarinimicrobiota bacterium]